MSKRLPKVLIAIPTYDSKNYCLNQFMDNIMNFTYPKSRIEIYVADNSKTNSNALYIRDKFKVKTFWKDYTDVPLMEKLADCHNQLRRYFLVNGLYQVFDASWRQPCIRLQDKKHELANSFVFPMELGNFQHFWIDGTLKPTFVAGIGCCLMKRKVMTHFEFRIDKNNKEGHPPDTYFAEDLRFAGVQNWVHTGQLCFHWNREDWGRHSEHINYQKSE